MALFTTVSPQYMYSYVIRPINSQIQSILNAAVRTLLWFSQDYTQADLKAIKTSLTPYTQTVVRMLLNFHRTIYDITVRGFCGVFGILTNWGRVTLYPPIKCAIIASDIGRSHDFCCERGGRGWLPLHSGLTPIRVQLIMSRCPLKFDSDNHDYMQSPRCKGTLLLGYNGNSHL